MAPRENYIPKRFRVRQRRVFPGDRRKRPHAVKMREAYETRMRIALDQLDWSQRDRFDLAAQAVLNFKPFPVAPDQDPQAAVICGIQVLSKLLPQVSIRAIAELAARACIGLVPLAEVPELVNTVLDFDGTLQNRRAV